MQLTKYVKYRICSYFFTVIGLALDDRGNLARFPGHSMRYSPRQRVHTVPGDYLVYKSICYGDFSLGIKRKGVNLTVQICVLTRLRMFTATYIPLNGFLARKETTLLTRKTKYCMGEERVHFMTCITCKPYTT